MKLLNKTQSGRSMVEMLGVLAIIGVLSVGGIAGYSKAMYKHKFNQTMDIISHTVARIVEFDTMRLGDEIYTAQDAINYGLIPDCDVDYINIEEQKGSSCPLPVGEFSFDLITSVVYGEKLYGEFSIIFTQNPVTSCVEFFNSGIYKNVPDDWWNALEVDGHGGYIIVYGNSEKYVYGKEEWPISQGAKPSLTTADIVDACGVCADAKFCKIYWQIRNEL